MRHWIIRACAVLLPVSGFAAAPAPQTDQPVKPVTAQTAALPPVRDTGFVYCVNGNISTFNPQLASSGLIVEPLAAQIYDRLLDVDPYTYRLIPELAARWTVLDNGATYRFYLRRDTNFQTTDWFRPTRKMNADDVVFSFSRVVDKQNPYHYVNGGRYPYFDSLQFASNVKSIRKINNHTVEFRLNTPDASFLWHLATHYAPVLSKEYADNLLKTRRQEQLDWKPVGTGPYYLDDYQSGQFVRLQRHDNYRKGKPACRKWSLISGRAVPAECQN